jgi:hypothetical protein
MNRSIRTAGVLLATVLAVAGCSRAPAATPTPPGGGDSATRPAPRGNGPRAYTDIITDRAVTQEGMFRVHRMGDSLYFEIPREEIGREMLLIGRPVESTLQDPGGFFGGGARQIVQWDRQGDRVILRAREFDLVADTTSAIWRQVEGFRRGAVLAIFPVAAYAPDSAAVINVSDLFLSNIPELSPVEGINRGRSWIDRTWSFPRNVNVEVTQSGQARPAGGGGPGGPGGGQAAPRSQTVKVHFSMLKLPDDPMMPRWHDERVGFNSSRSYDMSRPEQRAQQVRFIHRHRLEKRDPSAAVSDPVEPIIYWIDPATPDWLKPWIVEGVDKWQPAFEAAGFRNAIQGRIAPTPEEDPDFSLFDARHHVIYWRPSTVANATGGQVVDPRSGEILKGEVNMYHNIMELQKNWYITQVAPLDERAWSIPFPDSLMGRLVEYVVTHEIGHAIGLPHNMKASAMYPVDSIRDRGFLERMNGHVATLMDYSRFNYVAQPEDSIPPHLLIPQVGPYDVFSVQWGYTPIPSAGTPDEELATLDEWARVQDEFPWLRFSTADATADPFNLTEAVGDADAVRSTTLGMLNLERVVDLLPRIAEVPGESYAELATLYGQAVGQWGRYMGHVAAVVGGAYTQETYGRGPRFEPVERARQRQAVEYLNRTAFQVPEMFLDDGLLRRIENEGVVDRFRVQQSRILGSLLSQPRLNRLVEFEALAPRPADTYTIAELMSDVRDGVWGELDDGSVRVNVYRRNLQRAFLDAADSRLNPTEAELTRNNNPAPQPWASDVRGVMRAELQDLDRLAERAIGRAADDMTRIHLRDVRMEIARILAADRQE